MAREPKTERGVFDEGFVESCNARMQHLEMLRWSWWYHWRELAEYILPRRFDWLLTQTAAGQQYNRGSPINQRIIDDTGTTAARKCAAGLTAGITSPSRPWFRLTTSDPVLAEDSQVKEWLDACTQRMLRVMASSNYYLAKGTQDFDKVVFGTAPMIIYEDWDRIIHCYNPVAGEYYCAVDARNEVTTLGRRFIMTVFQLVDQFGLDALPENIRLAWNENRGAQVDTPHVVNHLIEPNPEYVADADHIGPGGVPRSAPYREIYWLWNANDGRILQMKPFEDKPFSCPRWDVTGNDPYGRSPGMDALGDIKQLQFEQKRKAQSIDKNVNPPMVAHVSMKNEPASLLPGAVTYTTDMQAGFKAAYEQRLQLGDLREDILDVRQRIKDIFFNDVFFMISNLDTVRSATEIDARREEQLLQLGPVIERNETESLSPDLQRIFRIMARRGLLPPPPQVLRNGMAIKVEYISMLADAQRAAGTAALERTWAFAGNIAAGVGPDVLDNLDSDETIRSYADMLRVSPKMLRDRQEVQARREQRRQAEQAAAAQAQAAAAAEGAKTLSETEVGGGNNALELMLRGVG